MDVGKYKYYCINTKYYEVLCSVSVYILTTNMKYYEVTCRVVVYKYQLLTWSSNSEGVCTSTTHHWHYQQYLASSAITLVVLCTNGAVCSSTHAWYTSRRSMYTVDHLYLGTGLHDVLRILLACIESVSILFRAVSLSLRVVCNSIAGHLLVGVLLEMTTTSACTVLYSVTPCMYVYSWWVHTRKCPLSSSSRYTLIITTTADATGSGVGDRWGRRWGRR